MRLLEDIACHRYYNSLEGEEHRGFDEEIDEELCKGGQVQNQLNMLFGVLHFLGPIPGRTPLWHICKLAEANEIPIFRRFDYNSLWITCR